MKHNSSPAEISLTQQACIPAHGFRKKARQGTDRFVGFLKPAPYVRIPQAAGSDIHFNECVSYALSVSNALTEKRKTSNPSCTQYDS